MMTAMRIILRPRITKTAIMMRLKLYLCVSKAAKADIFVVAHSLGYTLM